MFRTVPLSIIRSLFTVHSAMVYVIQVCRPSWFSSKAVYKPVWHIPLLSVQWINSWWWTEELSETYRVSCQNQFVKLVHLVGFIIKKPLDLFWGWRVWGKISKTPSSASKSYKTQTLAFKYCALTGTKVINISLCERSSTETTMLHDQWQSKFGYFFMLY
jgi:hypothetical protein